LAFLISIFDVRKNSFFAILFCTSLGFCGGVCADVGGIGERNYNFARVI
jgi:hypothetical protein